MDDQLAQRLVKARSVMEWSQNQLSEVSGVAAAQISRYEAGRSTPRAEVTAKLAKALGVQFEWLAYGRGPIDTRLEIPQYPTGVTVIPLEFEEQVLRMLDSIAERRGLTREMTLKSILAENMADIETQFDAIQLKNVKPTRPSKKADMQKFQEMDARLARLEAKQKKQDS